MHLEEVGPTDGVLGLYPSKRVLKSRHRLTKLSCCSMSLRFHHGTLTVSARAPSSQKPLSTWNWAKHAHSMSCRPLASRRPSHHGCQLLWIAEVTCRPTTVCGIVQLGICGKCLGLARPLCIEVSLCRGRHMGGVVHASDFEGRAGCPLRSKKSRLFA